MFNLMQDIKPISYVKAHTAEMVKQVGNSKKPVIITQNGEAKAVLIDVESYQGLIDSVNLMKLISIGENDFQNKNVFSNEEVIAEVNKVLGD